MVLILIAVDFHISFIQNKVALVSHGVYLPRQRVAGT